MDYKTLIGKNVLDKDSLELGEISRIDWLPHLLTKKQVQHLIISFKVKWRKAISTPIDTSEITKVEGNNVWLTITKKSFLEKIEREKILQKERSQYKGSNIDGGAKWYKTRFVDTRQPNRRRK
ncbi:MAG: hypothetical protein ACTSSH_13765 [Candidatus Heimdallarchaeota archaeon]